MTDTPPSEKRLGTRLRIGVAIAFCAVATPLTALAYPPGPGEPAVSIQALSPTCVADAPYVEYSIATENLASSGPVTLDFTDTRGDLVESRTVGSLSGTTLYPGAELDEDGTAGDWPGWQLADDGVSWVHDPSDSHFREGLQVAVSVGEQTATGQVSYPAADSGCAGPVQGVAQSPPSGAVPAGGQLPRTGNTSMQSSLMIASGALVVGLGLAAVGRRRLGHTRTG